MMVQRFVSGLWILSGRSPRLFFVDEAAFDFFQIMTMHRILSKGPRTLKQREFKCWLLSEKRHDPVGPLNQGR
jgi:hypothetical protein